ncbi:hypothetical protein EMIHUDRAFT_118740 [Emiliania huxleyi CCMP1516]|uniref:Hexosyltransferase n=2 Tax=Emiliania huxleyi TaxID=2903 RepID=A0A0D3J0R8_EMIH1|nr:hypothetical protein EMIHUDRAFT_118740 [Emiliania huxleyi CCMP1516]EOD17103.1 hypothetical protein EMIHUDRAFT_118740 [Emiliania huxleyi CCMP1516]|eukprot:XP_005769532.1 hypothetical protein EMIHUDRAFT_118740 [Emiliania huxleyi CCMP1516]
MPSIDLLVFSSNGARGALQRGLTRATWLDAWVGGGGRGAGSGRRIALFALCGAEAERLTPLREGRGGGAVGSEEAPRLGLLHLTCTDGYRHLLLKTLHALRWLLRRRPPSLGPPARLIFKTDEDTYLCVGSLGATLSTLPQLYSLYLGTFSDHTKLRFRRTERWRDTQHFALFNFSSYPPYAQGALYGLSSDLAAAALHIGESPPLSLLSLPLDKMRGPRRIPQPARLAASARGRVAFVSLPVRVYLSVDAYGGDRRQSGLLRVNNETVARAENSAACRMAASWKLVGVHKLRPLEALSCARASCAACGCSADPDPPGAFERLAREWDHAR